MNGFQQGHDQKQTNRHCYYGANDIQNKLFFRKNTFLEMKRTSLDTDSSIDAL